MNREINLPLLKTDYSDQWAVAISKAMKEYATAAVLADRAEQQERKSMGVPPMQAMPIEGSPNEYLAKPEQPAPAWHDAVREQRDFLLASQALLIESANSGQEAQQAEIERLRNLIAAHVNSSNNDDSAGDTFGALMAEVIKETP